MNTVRLIKEYPEGGRTYPVGTVMRKPDEKCAKMVADKVAVYHGAVAAKAIPTPQRRGGCCGWNR